MILVIKICIKDQWIKTRDCIKGLSHEQNTNHFQCVEIGLCGIFCRPTSHGFVQKMLYNHSVLGLSKPFLGRNERGYSKL